MFKKVLVANRGEIAVRIIRACRELGLETVAIYSEADRTALHVRYADEAYPIGPAPVQESYLRWERIIHVAIKSRADAVHPGYGFLAENPIFAQACQEAGLIFVGPNPQTIRLMSDKMAARRVVKAAGVPIAPGTEYGLSDEELIVAAEELGYPLLIKPAHGGGGKGMRIIESTEEMSRALATARRESKVVFGDDILYLEKIVEGARHIEFQILADGFGNVIHLGERECSIQRRHQKLIEEAPSRAVDEELRRRMGEAAIKVAHTVGYLNAGTVEFLLDKSKNFYFIELNCRLQVEHPVTEMVTGIDLVKEQLRVASGRRLHYSQDDVRLRGWAIECRIIAEDPYKGFLPSPGRITGLYEPSGPGVRVDSGVYEGFEVSLYYDSLIGKLITWGETRGEAILRMRRALDEYRIIGIKTNIPFHQQIVKDTRFIGGQFDTKFVEDRFSMVESEREEHLEVVAMAATLLAQSSNRIPPQTPEDEAPGGLVMRYIATVGDKSFTIEIDSGGMTVDGQRRAVDIERIDGVSIYSLLIEGNSYEVFVEEKKGEYQILLGGELYSVRVEVEEVLGKLSGAGTIAAIAVAIASLLEEVPEARLEVAPSPTRGLSPWALWGRCWQLMRSRELRRGRR
jgi:acetyl-CoA carboxylase biotin carboxylase subunit